MTVQATSGAGVGRTAPRKSKYRLPPYITYLKFNTYLLFIIKIINNIKYSKLDVLRLLCYICRLLKGEESVAMLALFDQPWFKALSNQPFISQTPIGSIEEWNKIFNSSLPNTSIYLGRRNHGVKITENSEFVAKRLGIPDFKNNVLDVYSQVKEAQGTLKNAKNLYDWGHSNLITPYWPEVYMVREPYKDKHEARLYNPVTGEFEVTSFNDALLKHDNKNLIMLTKGQDSLADRWEPGTYIFSGRAPGYTPIDYYRRLQRGEITERAFETMLRKVYTAHEKLKEIPGATVADLNPISNVSNSFYDSQTEKISFIDLSPNDNAYGVLPKTFIPDYPSPTNTVLSDKT